MRIQLVFHTWLGRDSKPVTYYKEELSVGNFHAGSTFDAKIDLDLDAADDLRAALAEGYKPVFYAMAVDPDSWRSAANKLLEGD